MPSGYLSSGCHLLGTLDQTLGDKTLHYLIQTLKPHGESGCARVNYSINQETSRVRTESHDSMQENGFSFREIATHSGRTPILPCTHYKSDAYMEEMTTENCTCRNSGSEARNMTSQLDKGHLICMAMSSVRFPPMR